MSRNIRSENDLRVPDQNQSRSGTEIDRHPVTTSWLDGLAIGASAACLLHCLLLPVLLAAVPTASRTFNLPEELHLLAFAAAIPISAVAMRRGYRKHGLLLPIGLGVLGIALLGIGALAALSTLYETGFSLAGSVVLALAHIRNWQLRKVSPLALAAPALAAQSATRAPSAAKRPL